jgi:Flp pilus assembly protein TadD
MPRTKRRRGQRGAPNVVEAAVETLGGPIPTAAAAGTAMPTVYLAMREGRFRLATAVLRIAAALEPDDAERQLALARRLAALPD